MTIDNQQAPVSRGRPRLYADEKAARAAASRAYRLRKKEEREQRRDATAPLVSRIIDLSALPTWRRG